MPRCKDCTHYWSKSFPEMPWNYECKFGHSTPDYGDTESCSDFEEQYTIGLARGWSYREEEQRERGNGYSDDEHHEDTEHEEERKKDCDETYSGYSSCGTSSETNKCGCGCIVIVIIWFVILLFSGKRTWRLW